MFRHRISSALKKNRRASATVEFAVVFPVIVLCVLAAIEGSNAIFLSQSLTSIAYETAQVASAVGGTQVSAEMRANELITAYSLQGATVSVSPPITAHTDPGTPITVSVSAPADSNSLGVHWFFIDKTITKQVLMHRL